MTRAALTLIFYLPESLWPYIPLLGTVVFTGAKIPLPAGLWLGWSFLGTLRAAGLMHLTCFFREALIILAAIFYGSFLRRQAQAGREPLGAGFFSLIILPMIVLGLFQAAAGLLPQPPSWLDPRQRPVVPFRLTGTLDNPNLFGMILAFILPLLLTSFVDTGGGMGRRRLFYIFAGFLHIAALLFTFSRTAWLAAGTAFLVFQGREGKPLLLRLAILLLFIFLVFPALRARLYPPGGLWRDSTVAYRRQIWEASWELFKENPLGTGSGGFQRAEPLQRRLPAVHAHNQLLQIAVEQGIPGLFLFSWVVYLGFSKPAKTVMERGVQAALCGQLAAGLTESPWADPLLLFLFWCGWAFLREAADG
ncbi:MAG: O-antigen ligase family protein [Clostridia bacterium]|nr:O-antigen ligase family protein [Clostridia bacterium]